MHIQTGSNSTFLASSIANLRVDIIGQMTYAIRILIPEFIPNMPHASSHANAVNQNQKLRPVTLLTYFRLII